MYVFCTINEHNADHVLAFWMMMSPDTVSFCGFLQFDPETQRATYYWFFMWSSTTDDMLTASPAEQLAFVHERTTTMHPSLRKIFELTQVSGMFPAFPIRDLIVPPTHGEKVVLLGDAAHPMTFFRGEGANQAMMDATRLAEELDAAGGDVKAALGAYEREMVERGTKAVEVSRAAAMALGKLSAR